MSHRALISVRWVLAALAAAAGAMASPSHAAADRFEATFGWAAQLDRRASVDALGDSPLVAFAATFAMDLPWPPIPGLGSPQVEAGFQAGGVSGHRFQTVSTETSLVAASLGARIRRALGSRWTVHGRVALGLARVGLGLTAQGAPDTSLSDHAYSASAYMGAGADVMLVRKRRADGRDRFSFGLRAELGYVAASPVELLGSSESEGDLIRIPTAAASLGDLDLSGSTLRVALVYRF